MKQLILPIFLSLTLIACSSGGAAPNSDNTPDPVVKTDTECPEDISKCDPNTEIFKFTESLGAIIVGTQTEPALNSQTSLTTVASTATLENSLTVTLPAIAVLFNDSTAYTRIDGITTWRDDSEALHQKGLTLTRTASLSRTDILGDSAYPTVQLSFDGTSTIGAEIYADKTYSATADRDAFFTSPSASMAYVTWTQTATADFTETNASPVEYSKMGMAIAGFATEMLSDIGTATFTGKGEGVYGVVVADSLETYNTTFTTGVTVNFAGSTLNFTTTNIDCDDCTLPEGVTNADLDLTATGLGFVDGNNISGTIDTTVASTQTNILAGTVDARFYGANTVASPLEFGGTFALINADTSYYYGAFGARIDASGIITTCAEEISSCTANIESFTFAESLGALTVETQTEATDPQPDSLTVVADANSTVTLPAIAVLFNDSTDYMRGNNALDWMVAGDLNPNGITIARTASLSRTPLDSSPYPTISLTFDGANPIVAVVNADETYTTTADTSSAFFGFTAANMAYVTLTATATADFDNANNSPLKYSKQGMAIAGIETTDFMGLNGGAQFTGKGKGVYGVLQTDESFTTYNTIFDIIVNANFTNKTVDFHSTGTVACMGCTALPTGVNLDVTAVDLSFADDANNAVNNTSGDATAGTLSGTLDARFYGTDDTATTEINESAKEFGGTFALTHADTSYYYGAFGAEVGEWSVVSNDVTTLATITDSTQNPEVVYTTPTADEASKQGLTSFTDDTRFNNGTPDTLGDDVGLTNITLPASIVTIERSTTSNTITNTIVGNDVANHAVLDFSYNATGQFVASATNPTALYFGDKRYAVLASLELSQDTIKHDGANVDTSDGANINAFIINKADSSDSFGFAAEYMVNISWATLNNTAGAGIAGFETATPLTAVTTRFNGRGIGYYADTTFQPSNGIRYFDMVADIDFGNYIVALESSNTCTSSVVTDCTGTALKTEHDFKGDLTYKAGTNALTFTNLITRGTDGSFATTDGKELAGTANAKFYGGDSQELGGTFSLQNASGEGYVGFFGAQRGYVLAPKTVAIATTNLPTETDNVTGLTGFQDPTRGTTGKENNYLNVDNLVRIKDDNITRTITLDGVTGAVAYFEYASDGNYATNTDAAATGLQLYIDNKHYISGAHTGDGAAISATGVATGGGDGVTISNFQLDSDDGSSADKTGVFGFINYYYLALVSWDETHNDYNRFGYGITGYETATTGDNALLTTGTNIFTGIGRGRYQEGTGTTNTRFNIEAEIDFATRMVSLKSTGTSACDADGKNCVTPIAHLNFMTDVVTYDAGTNALNFNNVTTDGYVDEGDAANNIASLSGDLSAKFYGPLTSELGGTFSFQNDIAGYIGYFGAERDYIVNATIASTPADAVITNNNTDPVTMKTVPTTFTTLTDFNDPMRNDTVGNALPMELVKITTNFENKTISSDIFTGGAVEFSYSGAGNWQSVNENEAVTLYFADRLYSIGGFGNGDAFITRTSNDVRVSVGGGPRIRSSNDVAPSYVELARGYFGFNAAYMASIRYTLKETTYDSFAYGMAGFDTTHNGGIIKTTGTTIFTGKGRGYANDKSNDNRTIYFDIDAEIDFATRMVSLQSKNSCTNSHECGTTQRPDYNFSGNLIYADGVNALTGTFTTVGDENRASLTGAATAKFYGPQSDELGGTFALSNANANYVGYFGGQRSFIVLPVQLSNTSHTETPMSEDKKSLTGFNDTSRAGVTGVTLNVASIVQITKNADAEKETILNEKISGGVTQFNYDAETDSNQPNYEHFADSNALTLYFADKKYESTSGYGDADGIRSSVTNTDGDVPDYFDLDIDAGKFGFLSKYMARFYWEIYQNKTYGFGITGFETDGADIPTTGTGIIFTGEGQGQYHDKDSATGGGGNLRYFAITATADFGERKVALQSSNTCSSTLSASSICTDGNSQKNHLNFKGELSYGVTTGGTPTAINNLTGTIKTAGGNKDFANDDGTEMNGSANARFYGTGADVATEFGGTFSLTGADSGYVGYFGAKKP